MSELLRKHAKQLKLPYIYQNIEHHLEQAKIENLSYEEFLLRLFQYEAELRAQNSVISRTRAAKFPYLKYLDDIQIVSLPLPAQEKYHALTSLDFIKRKQNLILAGNPGTGKTHLGIGLGIKACEEGYHVYFAHVPSLIIELKEAKNERMLRILKKKFKKYDLVILDELGYISFDKEGAELLFNFISDRCEHASTIFTTNLPFDRWDEIFHDAVITAAIVDRITHKSYVINMNGNSYRLQESMEFMSQSN